MFFTIDGTHLKLSPVGVKVRKKILDKKINDLIYSDIET